MKRIGAIDALRGLTIFGMILCASIGYFSDLPAWMFHCQVPPFYDYEFHPEVRGITWVDLVFPFFIFSMGAAIPFSLSRKIEKGESWKSISLGIIKRWAILVAFSLVLGNADALGGQGLMPYGDNLFRLIVWLALFAALWNTKRRYVNLVGWIVVAALMAFEHFVLGQHLTWKSNDCIIMLLSTVCLFGSFIWLITRNSFKWRLVALAVLIGLKIAGFNYLQYLVMAVPATMAGDALMRNTAEWKPDGRTAAAAWICVAATVLQLWGLFVREVDIDMVLTLVLAIAYMLLTAKDNSVFAQIGWMAFAMLIAGIAYDAIDGGIAKDHCNLSYLLVTGGQSALTLDFLLWVESKGKLSKTLTMTGQNPMIAYKIAWWVICPLLSIIGFQGWFDSYCVGNQFLGVVRGFIITFLMQACTCIFTKHKIFWKS